MDPNNIQLDEPKGGCSIDLIATLLIVGVFIVAIIQADTHFKTLIKGIGFLLIVISIINVLVIAYDLLIEFMAENRRLNRYEGRMQMSDEEWNEYLS